MTHSKARKLLTLYYPWLYEIYHLIGFFWVSIFFCKFVNFLEKTFLVCFLVFCLEGTINLFFQNKAIYFFQNAIYSDYCRTHPCVVNLISYWPSLNKILYNDRGLNNGKTLLINMTENCINSFFQVFATNLLIFAILALFSCTLQLWFNAKFKVNRSKTSLSYFIVSKKLILNAIISVLNQNKLWTVQNRNSNDFYYTFDLIQSLSNAANQKRIHIF